MGHIKCVTSVKNSSIYDCAIWSTIVLLLPFPLLLKFMMLKKLRSGKCFLPLEAFVLFTWVSSSFQCSECTSAFVPVTLLQTLESKFGKRSSGLIALVAYTLIFLTGAIMPFLKLFFFLKHLEHLNNFTRPGRNIYLTPASYYSLNWHLFSPFFACSRPHTRSNIHRINYFFLRRDTIYSKFLWFVSHYTQILCCLSPTKVGAVTGKSPKSKTSFRNNDHGSHETKSNYLFGCLLV